MLKGYVKILLFLSSYTPLFILLGLKIFAGIQAKITFSLICLIFTLLPFVIMGRVKIHKETCDPMIIEEATSKDGEIMSYVVSYLLPFLDIKSSFYDILALIVVFVILMILYVNSNLFFINPILTMAGYHIYEVQTASKAKIILITREQQLVVNEKINAYSLDRNIYFMG